MTLPTWEKDAAGRWTCADLAELAFAQKAQFAGFSVPDFDIWLSALPESDGKKNLRERRAKAKAAQSMDVALRHLEFLHTSRAHMDRTDTLRPLANTGAKVRQPFADANSKSRANASARYAVWQGRADELRAQPQHANKSASDIARLIQAETGDKAATIRRKLRKLS